MNRCFRKKTAFLLAVLFVLSITAFAYAEGENTAAVSATAAVTLDTDSIIDANELNSRIESYITEQGITGKNSVVSIGYCYTATGDTWYYDGDQWCYSASLYKVPCCMLLAEKEYNGEITKDTQINSQYASGTVEKLERKSIVNSDNYTGHAVVEYLGGTYSGKCADQTIKFTDLPEDYFPSDFTQYSYYSAKYYTQVLMTLFFNSEKYPRIMDYMKQDQSYHYLDKDLNGQYEVAQKYGAFEEKNGNKNYHSAGVVYTPNPVIITVLTKNITGFEKHIGALSKILVDYTLELDSRLTDYKANKLAAQQQEAARLAQEEQQRLAQEAAAQEAAAQQTAAAQSAQTAAPVFVDPDPVSSPAVEASVSSRFDNILSASVTLFGFELSFPVIVGLALVLIIFIVIFIIKLRNSGADDEEFDDKDYEAYERGDISDLGPRQEKKKGLFHRTAKDRNEGETEDDYDRFNGKKYDDRFEDSFDMNQHGIANFRSASVNDMDNVDDGYEEAYAPRYVAGRSGNTDTGDDYEPYAEPYGAAANDTGAADYSDDSRYDSRYDSREEDYEADGDYVADSDYEADGDYEAGRETANPEQDVRNLRSTRKTSGGFFGKKLFGRNRKAQPVEYEEEENTVYSRGETYEDNDETVKETGSYSGTTEHSSYDDSLPQNSGYGMENEYDFPKDDLAEDTGYTEDMENHERQKKSFRFGRSSREGYTPRH